MKMAEPDKLLLKSLSQETCGILMMLTFNKSQHCRNIPLNLSWLVVVIQKSLNGCISGRGQKGLHLGLVPVLIFFNLLINDLEVKDWWGDK